MKSAIYPGTFDPLTLGHLDVIRRAATVFDRLVVAVAIQPKKQLWFSLEERMGMAEEAVRPLGNVEVQAFDGLLVQYARDQGVHVLVRGLRAFSDFEYEFQMALSNRKLAPDIETMFLMTSDTFSYISSSVVREVAQLGGNTSELVPPGVQAAIERRRS
ncbi:MAG TPA: pantetheine-phosphate adenylyltransferase [Kiritimatiellia bacterium]|nr:pantetheine-phosphate adenylyltransferase [Kiritimatiellia bacterium]